MRLVVTSLLLGITATLTLISLLMPSASPGNTTSQALQITANAEATDYLESRGDLTTVTLDARGSARLTFAAPPGTLSNYPFMYLALESTSTQIPLEATLFWQGQDGTESHPYAVENRQLSDLWIATNELPGWGGDALTLTLALQGAPNSQVVVHTLSLHGSSLANQLRSIRSDWIAFVPWKRASMNSHTGVTKVSSYYPVPLMACVFMFSLLAYLLLSAWRQRRVQADWRALGLIFLACWLALDLAWQKQLLHQVAATRVAFAGKSEEQKLASGPDAELYQLVRRMRDGLPPEARVIVASSDDYTGLRSAYYLLPRNVYWSLRGPEMPPARYLQSGDYVLKLSPTELNYNSDTHSLLIPNAPAVSADLIIREGNGSLLRVH
ncbi:MAG: hypothetical protein AAGA91_06625 [Pseudomonadota bacterium]